MQVLRNAFIAVLSGALLCGTLICTVLDRSGFDFPQWASVNTQRSYLEGRSYQAFPDATQESIAEGAFQDEFEQYVADLVPMRDDLLLANASLQRISSMQMAKAFDFDAYPTFFGSEYYYLQSTDSLYAMPAESNDVNVGSLSELADRIVKIAQSHPEVRCSFYKAPRSCDLPFEPVVDLVGDPLTAGWWDEVFFSKMDGSVQVIDTGIDTFEEFCDMYARTDHHWEMDGAYQGYVDVSTALGFGSELVEKGQRIEYEQPVFYGSHARGALEADGPFDLMYDYRFDLPDYALFVNGKEASSEQVAHVEMYSQGDWQNGKFVNRYGEYFHGDRNVLEFVNQEREDGGTLLIVGDSFTNAMERLFTAHYKRVYVIDPRHSKQTVSEVIDDLEDVSDVVFLMSYNTLVNKNIKNTMA